LSGGFSQSDLDCKALSYLFFHFFYRIET
jgi:hypothetical protein